VTGPIHYAPTQIAPPVCIGMVWNRPPDTAEAITCDHDRVTCPGCIANMPNSLRPSATGYLRRDARGIWVSAL
jgi:hypothetical protein